MRDETKMRVLICGGGVIGAAIAYFLSRRGVRSMVIERGGLACEEMKAVGRSSVSRSSVALIQAASA